MIFQLAASMPAWISLDFNLDSTGVELRCATNCLQIIVIGC